VLNFTWSLALAQKGQNDCSIGVLCHCFNVRHGAEPRKWKSLLFVIIGLPQEKKMAFSAQK